MVRWKIREKRPGKKIKQKTPKNSKNLVIKSKLPNGLEKAFELPPLKEKLRPSIPKSSISPPSRHRVLEPLKDDIPHINVPPPISNQKKINPSLKPIKSPIKEKDQHVVESKSPPKISSQQERPPAPPSSLGTLSKGNRKKITPNRPVPIFKHPNKEIKVPRPIRSPSKEKLGFVNKPLPRIKSKKPPKANLKILLPTSRGADKKKEFKAINRPIPKTIKTKTPSKQKPPPTFEEKIPKSQIRTKKPRSS